MSLLHRRFAPSGPERSRAHRGRPPVAALAAALVVGSVLAGCGDDFLTPDWDDTPDTLRLFSLALPDLNLPAAVNFHQRTLVRIETPTASGQWDLALDTRDGELVFLVPLALNIDSRARIEPRPGAVFEDVAEAPRDTLDYADPETAVPVDTETVYVVRTGESIGSFRRRCVYFAKLQPIEVDAVNETVTFKFIDNPICNDPRLIPPDR